MKSINTTLFTRTFFRQQLGVTLIELMIALVISLVLIFGVVQLFMGSQQTYRLQEGISRIQENNRFALHNLQHELRMAGFVGCTKNITNWINPGTAPYLVSQHIPVIGWEASGTAPGNSYSIISLIAGEGTWANGDSSATLPATLASSAIPGTDIVIINRSHPTTITLSGNSGNTLNVDGSADISEGAILTAVTSDCSGGDMFQATNNTADTLTKGASGNPGNSNAAAAFSHIHDDQSVVYIWESAAYYIGRNETTNQPSLYRMRLSPTGGFIVTDEMVEGVESMQVLYGVDSNGNRQVNTYRTAADVTDWTRVLSTRLSLLFRSLETSLTDNNERKYNLIGTEIEPISDQRIRQVAITTIGLRNRLD